MKSSEDYILAVADLMEISEEQIERRKKFLELGESDVELLRDLHERLSSQRLDFVESFYEHLLSSDETRKFLSEPKTLDALKRTQATYFEGLTAGQYDWPYVVDRLRVGVAHQRVGLGPELYLGGYRKYLCWLLPEISQIYDGDTDRAVDTYRALMKIVFFDMGLAVDSYIGADRLALVATRVYAERIVASVPSGLLVVGQDLTVFLANHSFREMFGGTKLVGRPLTEVLPVEGIQHQALEVLKTGESVRHMVELTTDDYGIRPFRITTTRIRRSELEEVEEVRLLVVVEDLTDEQQLRATVRASEMRFHQVVEHASDGLVIMGEHGRITFFNAAAEGMFGYSRQDVIGLPATTLMPASHRTAHESGLARYLKAERLSAVGSVRQIEGLRKNGTVFPIECTVSTCRIDGCTVFTGVLRDVTDRIRIDEALRRSERSFRTLIERIPDAIAVHRRGRFVYVNSSMVRFLGYADSAELVGESVLAIVHPDDHDVVAARIESMVTTGNPVVPQEERFVRQDGSTIHAEVVATPLEYEGEPAVVAIARDITERKELTARMMRMDRMIAVGTLAAGVGHEINNPLTYVTGNLGLALEQLTRIERAFGSLTNELALRFGDNVLGEVLSTTGGVDLIGDLADLRDVLNDARDGGDRIRDIVRVLGTFSRGGDEKLVPVAIPKVITSAINMAFNEVRHRARLLKDFSPVPNVRGNQTRLGQVFLNLIVNAAHAIDEGAAESNEIRVSTFVLDGEVVVEVADTGKGIASEDLPRLFDPFFTTKPIGQGTGLGLSICQQIIEAHGGRIEVESRPDRGSVFRVLLPAELEEPPAFEPRSPSDPPTHRGRILVIDDEPMILRVIERALGSEHEIQTFTSAHAALARLTSGVRFDLVLCDLMMPDMTGMALHDALCQSEFSEAAERMIFLTGGAFTAQAREFLDHVPNLHLEKPFEPRNLRALVRNLLR